MGERFLKAFGKPERLLTCECERNDDPGLLQAFQLITGELVNELLRDPDNRIGKLLAAGKSDARDPGGVLPGGAVPHADRRRRRTKLLALRRRRRRTAGRRGRTWLWGLVNAKEFLLRR